MNQSHTDIGAEIINKTETAKRTNLERQSYICITRYIYTYRERQWHMHTYITIASANRLQRQRAAINLNITIARKRYITGLWPEYTQIYIHNHTFEYAYTSQHPDHVQPIVNMAEQRTAVYTRTIYGATHNARRLSWIHLYTCIVYLWFLHISTHIWTQTIRTRLHMIQQLIQIHMYNYKTTTSA